MEIIVKNKEKMELYMISEWFYDKNNIAKLYLDEDKFLSADDNEIGILNGREVLSLDNEIVGIYENGVIYDLDDRPVAFTEYAKGYIPSLIDILGPQESPEMADDEQTSQYTDESEVSDNATLPGGAGESGSPNKPVHNGWSDITVEEMFGIGI